MFPIKHPIERRMVGWLDAMNRNIPSTEYNPMAFSMSCYLKNKKQFLSLQLKKFSAHNTQLHSMSKRLSWNKTVYGCNDAQAIENVPAQINWVMTLTTFMSVLVDCLHRLRWSNYRLSVRTFLGIQRLSVYVNCHTACDPTENISTLQTEWFSMHILYTVFKKVRPHFFLETILIIISIKMVKTRRIISQNSDVCPKTKTEVKKSKTTAKLHLNKKKTSHPMNENIVDIKAIFSNIADSAGLTWFCSSRILREPELNVCLVHFAFDVKYETLISKINFYMNRSE